MQPNGKLENIHAVIKDKLEENTVCQRTESRYHRGSFCKISGGRKDDEVPAPIHWKNRQKNIKTLDYRLDDVVRELKKTLPNRGLLVVSLTREHGFSYGFATAETIVKMFQTELEDDYSDGFSEEITVAIAPDQQDEPEIEVFSKFRRADGSSGESDVMSAEFLVKCLYDVSDRKLTKIWILGNKDKVEIKTVPEIPGLTERYVAHEDLALDTSNLNEIYTFLESFSEAKIDKGLEILLQNPDFKAKAEKRYLNLIQNRLGEKATLEDFPKAALTRTEVNLLDEESIGKNFLSLSYFDKSKCELFVDFIGALVMNHLEITNYQQKAEACQNEVELLELYRTYCKIVKTGIRKEADDFPGGWFGKLSLKLHDHRIGKVLFEKTHFTIPDSEKLKAFVYYLTLNFAGEPYLDVFQSYLTELTPFFWFSPYVPKSSWGDTDIAIPKSTLQFTRKVWVRRRRWKMDPGRFVRNPVSTFVVKIRIALLMLATTLVFSCRQAEVEKHVYPPKSAKTDNIPQPKSREVVDAPITDTIVLGDLDHDKITDTAFVYTPSTLSTYDEKGQLEYTFGCVDKKCFNKVTFSCDLPPMQIENSVWGAIESAGDLNGDGVPEILFSRGWFIGSSSPLEVFQLWKGQWKSIAQVTFRSHEDEKLKSRLIRKNRKYYLKGYDWVDGDDVDVLEELRLLR